MIETVGLTKHFGGAVAVDGLTLAVNAGEVMGFLGPNGSGKTTTIRLLVGLLRPTTGTARILGRDCHRESVALKRHVGYMPEDPFIYPYLSGLEFLGFVGRLHGLDRRAAAARAAVLCARFGLEPAGQALVSTYSQGMRKRLAFAAALVHDPQVLILDEPTNGLDPRAAREVRDLIAALAAEGRTVFLSTHLLDTAERLCQRIAVIRRGVLRALGAPAELRSRHGLGSEEGLESLFLKLTEG